MNDEVKIIATWGYYGSSSDAPSAPTNLVDILDDGTRVGECFLLEFNGGARRLILLQECNYPTAHWTSKDAANLCLEAASCRQGPGILTACCIFQPSSSRYIEGKFHRTAPTNISLSLLPCSDPSISPAPNFQADQQQQQNLLREQITSLLPSYLYPDTRFSRKTLWILRTAALLLLLTGLTLLLLLFLIPNNQTSHPKFWQRYKPNNNNNLSRGPAYQLQFTHHNVTPWSVRYPSPNDDWFLRIDDQAMVPQQQQQQQPPAADFELRYQRWFRARYPEAERIRLQGEYLQESFLGDPSAIQVPADRQFHVAHCVAAVRRYWWARETGRHACPRDVDYNHMRHCLDALDGWAFPEGPRRSRSKKGMMHVHDRKREKGEEEEEEEKEEEGWEIDEEDDTRLVWRTKVCFDEGGVDGELARLG